MMERAVKPTFSKFQDRDLFLELREEVSGTVKKLEPERRVEIFIKAMLFPGIYILTYASALVWGFDARIFYGCYFFMGIFLVLNFLNIIHEAVHNTLFKNKRLNNWYVHFFDLMGANSYIWKVRHIRLHHNYPNVMGWDSDFEQSDLARVFPHGAYSKMHKYQHIYLPFI